MLTPEAVDTGVSSSGITSTMPTRKKPHVTPSFSGLGFPAPAPKPETASASAASKKASNSKPRGRPTAASKSATKQPAKASNRVSKASPKASGAAKGKGKARVSPIDQRESADLSASEHDHESSSQIAAKARSTRGKAGETSKATDKKRKNKEDVEGGTQATSSSRPTKRARVETSKAPPKPKIVINQAPTMRLDIYVCGEGSAGELGLGNSKGVTDVKRPRLNPHLKAEEIGVVHAAAGGMHAVALTRDNRILTWGVNDQGALGRDTQYDGGLQTIEGDNASDSSEDSDDIGLNPREATPTAIPADAFPEATVFTQLAAGDSCTFALTDEGKVYGWGTFRAHDGIMGFFGDKDVQRTPTLIQGLKDINRIVCGANHAMALDSKGKVFVWGCGEQSQLGYRPVERTKLNGLKPAALRMKGKVKMVSIGTGTNHAFSVDEKNNVWTWGSNSFGQTGIAVGAGDDNAVIYSPAKVVTLPTDEGDKIVEVVGGMHHSIAVTSSGKCLVWGRVDGFQLGIDVSKLPEDQYITDERNNPRILTKPTVVEEIQNAQFVAAGTDHNIALDGKDEAYAWGFSANYQTGLGTSEDVEEPTKIDNTATRGKKLTWAGAGGQYSMLAGPHVEA